VAVGWDWPWTCTAYFSAARSSSRVQFSRRKNLA